MRLSLRDALLAAIVTLAAPKLALAQSDEPGRAADEQADEQSDEQTAAKHFAEGRRLYTEGKYQEAIKELLQAYELRPAPPILLNVGRTYEKLGDKKKALEFYRKFLLKARLVDPNRKMVEGLVAKLEKETGDTGKDTSALETPGATSTSGGAAPLERRRRQQMIHTPIDSAKVDTPITVQAELPPGEKADKVLVHFRQGGQVKFRSIEMEKQGDGYVASIPAKWVTSTSLQYYIEARRKGAPHKGLVALAGSRSTPHIIVVEGGRAPMTDKQRMDIRSPYRTWFWVSAASAAALIGGGITLTVLGADRGNAMETIAQQSCARGCPSPGPTEAFDKRARDWESQGKLFNALGWTMLGVGIAAAGASAYLFYLDRKHVNAERKKRAQRERSPKVVRFIGAPWASGSGGGFVGRIDF